MSTQESQCRLPPTTAQTDCEREHVEAESDKTKALLHEVQNGVSVDNNGQGKGSQRYNHGHGANEERHVSQGPATEADEQAGKKPNTSARKIESNRRNSGKSTGPKTPRGKKTASANALKHGVFSKYLLIQDPDGNENPDEYKNFHTQFREQYRPVGLREEWLVEQITDCSWRLRRVLRCETGQIELGLAEHRYHRQLMKASLEESDAAPEPAAEMESLTDHLLLPPREEADKLLRYESMLTKQRRHLIAEVEKLQERRKARGQRQ